MIAAVVYLLCFLASLACSILVLRSYAQKGARILLWTGLCFVGLALNNALLFVDKILVPEVDLFLVRTLPALIGVALMIFGLIWEGE